MKNVRGKQMLEGYKVPAILVSTTDYEIQATKALCKEQFGQIAVDSNLKYSTVSHGYNTPCDQCGADYRQNGYPAVYFRRAAH